MESISLTGSVNPTALPGTLLALARPRVRDDAQPLAALCVKVEVDALGGLRGSG